MIEKYFIVNNFSDALDLYEKNQSHSKVISGGTDLMLEIEKGMHQNIDTIIDISRIRDLDHITQDNDGYIHLGALVSHNHCIKSNLIKDQARCLFDACLQVGSPQIRNRGTVVGNLVTASPANDSISALIALDAKLILCSKTKTREVMLSNFYTGVRRTVLKSDEIVKEIIFKATDESCQSVFIKQALRKSQAISVINTSVVLSQKDGVVDGIAIALGSVSPIVQRSAAAEQILLGKKITEDLINKAAKEASNSIAPITDIRSTSEYRKKVTAILVKRAIKKCLEAKIFTNSPQIALWGEQKSNFTPYENPTLEINSRSTIEVVINNNSYKFENVLGKNLLQLIREKALLTGTKEGCGEGECGACTVYLDGIAVMACLVPAARAHFSKITTIEGIAQKDTLDKVQKAFIQEGAVQCGYCTPGFIMSSVKLLEENPSPRKEEIIQAISGNLCRCTGYYKIVKAIETAVKM